ncbi:MAG: type II toxin-antitoxin system VapC family toxin [Zavarzinella sp.]|nr:type II toxin-antitoxin system VapC family toxin [Zavarzinella sp.]
MTTIFADTAYYLALANARDGLHDRAVAFLSGFSDRIVTTDYVLLEVANSHRRSAFRQAFLDLLETIRSDPDTEIVPAGPDLFQAGLDLFADRPDKDWSLTDCLSFVVMTDRGLTDAVTADHHFEQAGFRILLK